MPVVPVYGPRKVLTAPLPSVRKTAAATELSAGVGVEQKRAELALTQGRAGVAVGSAIAQFGGTLGEVSHVLGKQAIAMRKEEQDRADDIAVLHYQRGIAEWENDRLYNPETGALTKHGTDSFGLPETIASEYAELTGSLAAELTNDTQRIAAAKIASTRAVTLDLTLRRHVYTEMQRYEGQELQATVVNARNAAIAKATDPRAVGLELSTAVSAITTHGPRLGLGPKEIAQQVEAVQTEIHVGVIDSLLAQDLTKTAEIYFEETRSQITGTAIARIEKALDEGKVRKQAQERADAILAAGGTLTQQREQARAIEDPEVRDSVMQRLEHEAAVQEKTWRDNDEAELRIIYDVVDRTHDVTKIPPGKWANLDGSTRSALRGYANALAKGIPVETDWHAYYVLMQAAGDDPASFIKENLLGHRNELGEVEFKQLTSLQLALRQGDQRSADKELGGFQTKTEILDGALAAFKIDPNPKAGTKEAAAIAQLRRMLDLRVQTFEDLIGKKPTNVDMQRMLDGLLGATDTIPGNFWNFWPGGRPFFDVQKRLIDTTVEDIPAADRLLIEQALRAKGRPVSDVTVLDVWIETKLRTVR
jgi:hypothetical protein